MSVQFALLACGAALHILAWKLCKIRPPELGGNELVSFEITGMTSSLVVMTVGEDGVTEGTLWGNVDMAFISEDMIIELPVRKAGLEGSGDVFQG